MAYTIADYEKQATQPLKKFLLMNLLRYCDLMSLVPFDKGNSLTEQVTRWKTLPSVSYRQINGTYTESTGTTEQITEGLYALGGEIKLDRVFSLITNNIQDPKKTQTLMKIRAAAYQFNDNFINGDHALDVNAPEGLNKRIASYLPTRQSTAIGAAYDVTASSATENKFIDYMHELVDLSGLRSAPTVIVKKGDAQPAKTGALLMNRGMLLGVGRALRRATNLITTTQDAYGRLFTSFNGIPMIDVGLKADQSTEIILNTYGAAANETRIYAVRFGSDDGFTGIQLNQPDLYDPIKAGEGAANTTGPQNLLRMDWWYGFQGFGSYYAARLTGVLTPASWT